MLCLEPPSHRPPVTALFVSLAVFAVIDVIWISFFSLHPDEGKTVFQALYMSVITLSSVGFGWFTPVTEEGMIFGAYFMIFGCAALVNVITQFTDLIVKFNEYERFDLKANKKGAVDMLSHVCNEERLKKDEDVEQAKEVPAWAKTQEGK